MGTFSERPSSLPNWPAATLACCLLLASPLAADVAIVTGEQTALDTLDEDQARALWLGTLERVGGIRLRVADRSGDQIRDEFYRRVLRKTHGQVKAIRAKRAFQYGIAPPPELPTDDTVLDWVRERQNRLGYVDARAVAGAGDTSVKTLLIIEVAERNASP